MDRGEVNETANETAAVHCIDADMVGRDFFVFFAAVGCIRYAQFRLYKMAAFHVFAGFMEDSGGFAGKTGTV